MATEAPRPQYPPVSPEACLAFTGPTAGFLCPLNANVFGIEFLKFTIRTIETNTTVFNVERERTGMPFPPNLTPAQEILARSIRYTFSRSFLRFKTIGTQLVFAVGPAPLPNFRMIERHYFRDKLIKSFDFTFGFCIPNSINSWEAIYELPNLSPAEEQDIIEHPFETKSDSFYFVDNRLVMHNKAEYSYAGP